MGARRYGWCQGLLLRDHLCHCFFPPKINVGCSTDSSSADPVRLEFSRDFGATWHLLLPLCYHSSVHVSSLCSTEHHPSSTYYAGTTQGWRREVVHFGKLHLCGWGSDAWHHHVWFSLDICHSLAISRKKIPFCSSFPLWLETDQ